MHSVRRRDQNLIARDKFNDMRIRYVPVALVLLACTRWMVPVQAIQTPPDSAWKAYQYLDGKQYLSLVTRSALDRAPKWNPDEPFPPLPTRTAVSRAGEVLKKLDLDPQAWTMSDICLKPIGSRGEWIYLVTFDGPLPGRSNYGGMYPRFAIVVLMDGTAVVPTIQDPPEH